MRTTSAFAIGLFLAAVSVAPGLVSAHNGATGVVKDRMDTMKAIANEMKRIGGMIKGDAPFEVKSAAAAAGAIAKHGGRIGALFPEGTNAPPSEALDAIWQDWDDFLRKASRLEEAAVALRAAAGAASSAADIGAEFQALGGTCKSCHEIYRKKK